MWSFWSAPFAAHARRRWLTPAAHLMSWVLSVRTAAEHFPNTTLVTDDEGARLLVDQLQLPFGTVSTTLNGLRDADPGWWILGKLYAYREQELPFLHIDSDVYLWPKFPASTLDADVVAQNPEYAPSSDATYYKPTLLSQVVKQHGGRLPEEWSKYMATRCDTAICAGILGSTRPEFLRTYADRTIHMVECGQNQAAWRSVDDKVTHCVLIEQYYLAAYCYSVCGQENLTDRVQYLFSTEAEAFDSAASRQRGFTHLIGAAKSSRDVTGALEARVLTDYPGDFERCLQCVA